MAFFKFVITNIFFLLAGITYAQKSNPYLEYTSFCPSATISASSAKVSSCEQSIYTAVMSRADCQPVPVASCECEWFNSWVSTCIPNICPSTGVAIIASSRGSAYCTSTGTGLATATGGTVTSKSGVATSTATGSQGAVTTTGTAAATTAATTAKAGGVGGLVVPIGGGLLAGLVGIAALAL